MNNLNFNNKESLLNMRTNHITIILIVVAMCVFIIIYSFTVESYDLYAGKGYIYCENECVLNISDIPEKIGKLINIDYILLDNKKIVPSRYEIGKIEIDKINKINYQSILYYGDFNNEDKTLQEIKIFYDKEKIINKIIASFLK